MYIVYRRCVNLKSVNTVGGVMPAKVIMLLVLVLITACSPKQDTKELRLTGTIEATSVAASFKVPGRLKERLVDEGQQVRAGQIIARLEDDELKDEQRLRGAEQQAAQAGLADLQAGSRKEEIAAAAASLFFPAAESAIELLLGIAISSLQAYFSLALTIYYLVLVPKESPPVP